MEVRQIPMAQLRELLDEQLAHGEIRFFHTENVRREHQRDQNGQFRKINDRGAVRQKRRQNVQSADRPQRFLFRL